MSPSVASIIFGISIAGLFFLDRGGKTRVSKALWIPTVWLFFSSSRSLGQWLGIAAVADRADGYLEGSPVDRNFLMVLEVIALIVVIKRGRRVGGILRRNWAIVLFFSYAALSMAWSDFPFVTLKHWTKGIGDVMMVLIVLTELNVTAAVKRLVTRLGFVLIPLSLLLIWYYPSLGRSHTMDWTPEAVGVCTQKNGLGELCAFLGLALVWRFRSAYNDRKDPDRRRRLMALGAVLAINVWLLKLSHSMTSICAFILASGVMLLSTRPVFRRKPTFVHLLIGGVIVCTVYALFLQSSGALIRGLGRDSTLTGRTDIWPHLISLVNNRLLGVGYESFWLGQRLQKVWEITQGLEINEAHNGYVEVFLTLGWIGEVLLGVLFATGYRNLIRVYRQNPDAGSFRIAWFLAPVITGLTEAAFRFMGLPWIVFLLATAAAPWMAQRSVPAVVTSTQNLPESGQEADAVHEGTHAGY